MSYNFNSSFTRRIQKERHRRRLGKGYICVNEVPLPTWVPPRVLSRSYSPQEDGNGLEDGCIVTTRVRVPVSISNGSWQALGYYLQQHNVISTDRCQHAYDCCGHFYPNGCGRIVARQGRTIVVDQSFIRNV